MNKKALENTNLVIRQPRFIIWFGVVNNLFWSWLIIHMTFFPHNTTGVGLLIAYLGFGVFLLVGTWFIWITIIWKVLFVENGISFRNSVGKTKIISFSDIEVVKCKKNSNDRIIEAVLHSKDGKIILGLSAIQKGFTEFVNHLTKENIKFE